MDVRRMSVNKNNAMKPFVTMASDKFTSKNHVTGVYTPICFHTVWPCMCKSLEHTITYHSINNKTILLHTDDIEQEKLLRLPLSTCLCAHSPL